MIVGRLAAVLVLLATPAACSSDESGGTPPEPASSASATSSTTAGAGTDARQLFQAAAKPLLGQPVIVFTHTVYSGSALAVRTTGRAFQQVGWEATTTSPKQLGSAEAPQGDDVKGRMDVRAVGDELYLRLSSWRGPLAGCWLRTGPGQVPGGQLAMTPGVPGYITLLGALQPEAVLSQDGDDVVLGAEVPLRVGLQLLTTGVLGLLQLDASQLDGATVPVGVEVTGGALRDVELRGDDLVSAVRVAGGRLTPDAEATVSQLRIDLGYRAGRADAAPVRAPAAALVMTNADVRAGTGC